MNNFEIIITSLENEENLVAKIWHKGSIVSQIPQKGSEFYLRIYSCNYYFSYDEYIEILETAKDKLKALD